MIKACDLVEKCKIPLNDKWGYIYGTAGVKWTQAQQDKATREQTIKWGKKWIGHMVCDCSGLFVWAFKQLGGYMYHGSNSMFKKYSTATGELSCGKRTDGKELEIGSAVYKYNDKDGYHHVGIYIGGDTVIEAKGTYYGVVTSGIKEWSHWSELMGAYYGCEPSPAPPFEPYTATVTTASGKLNVRNRPRGTVVDKLPFGKAVTVTAEDGEWREITYDGKAGWVDGAYLVRGEAQAFKIRAHADKGETVNVRNRPITGRVEYKVDIGTVLEAVGTDAKSGWYRLKDGNYISNEFAKAI